LRSWSPRDKGEAAFGAEPEATRSAEQSVYARVGESGMAVEALLGAEEHGPGVVVEAQTPD
jgi:hypothetical protein